MRLDNSFTRHESAADAMPSDRAWWAHRNDEWQRRNLFLALLSNPHGIGRP